MDDSDYDQPFTTGTRPPRRLASHVARSHLREPSSDFSDWTNDSSGSNDGSDSSDSDDSDDRSDSSVRSGQYSWDIYSESEPAASSVADSESESGLLADDEEDEPQSRIVILREAQLKNAIQSTSEGMNRKRSAEEDDGEGSVHHRSAQDSSQKFKSVAKRRKHDLATQAALPILRDRSAILATRTSLQGPSNHKSQETSDSEAKTIGSRLFAHLDSALKAARERPLTS